MASVKFEDLEVWKRSARLSVALYKTLGELRDIGFRDQITRSGLSVPSNIAEGMERRSSKDKQRYLDIALGSSAELKTQIYIGIQAGFIPDDTGRAWIRETREISAMLIGLRNNLTDH